MSNGAQIGGVIGAAVGFYFGGPQGAQIGYTVGSVVGGYIDPAQVFGPQLKDAATQTAMDGVPRAYGYGTFPCAGNLIWCSDLTMRKKTESSKGAPTETVTYHYYRSYAIAVCEGPAHGNGIAGYRIIKRNGKVVYDTRTDDELSSLGYSPTEIAETRAAQTKFTQRARLYYGVADQLPDPTIQAVKGADDVPGYSYTAYIVITDEDLTELRGAVPQYEFVVSVCGDRTERPDETTYLLITGGEKSPGGPVFCEGLAVEVPVFTGIEQSTGANIGGATPSFYDGICSVVAANESRYSLDERKTWLTATIDNEGHVTRSLSGGSQGWITQDHGSIGSLTLTAGIPPDEYHQVLLTCQYSNGEDASSAIQSALATFQAGNYYYRSWYRVLFRATNPNGPWESVWDLPPDATTSIQLFIDGVMIGSRLYCIVQKHVNLSLASYQVRFSDDAGETWLDTDVLLDVPRGDGHWPAQLIVVDSRIVAYTTDGGVWTSENGWNDWIDTGLIGPGAALGPEFMGPARRIARVSQRLYAIGAGVDDGDKLVVSLDYGMTWGTPIELPIQRAVGIVACPLDERAWEPLPDAPGYFINRVTGEIRGPGGTTISECAPTLAEIAEDQCALRDVTTVDATDLEDDYVLGFRIANTSSPQKNIQAAMPGYFFDSSEFDGIQHFVKRGGEDSFHIPYSEMCTRDGDTVQWERTQEAELLRKVTFTYFDPRSTYTPTSQTSERRAGTIQAMGESASQLPIVGTGAWAAQAADINLKAAWAEPDECTLHVSLDWAELVTAAVGTIEDERGTIHRIRIQDIKDDGLVRMITGRRTNSAAFSSNAGGKPIRLPTFPGSDIRGPAVGALMNSPIIVDTDDKPGIYWAAMGLTSGYLGASLQLFRSGAWVELGQILGSSVVGTLAASLPNHAGDIDAQNIILLTMRSELESTNFLNLLGERNAIAILRPDSSVEIVQFQTATPTGADTFELSYLIRNRLNTYGEGHAYGATVVLLDSGISFAELRPEEIGQVLSCRIVSLGTNPDSAPVLSLDMTTAYSQREWEVANLQVVKDAGDYTLTWQPRHRLGSDVFPVRSTNWEGYLVRWQHSDQSHEEVISTESITFNLPGATDIEFTVAQINRFTGPGPETTVII